MTCKLMNRLAQFYIHTLTEDMTPGSEPKQEPGQRFPTLQFLRGNMTRAGCYLHMWWGAPQERNPKIRKVMTCPSSTLERAYSSFWNITKSPRERGEGLSLLLWPISGEVITKYLIRREHISNFQGCLIFRHIFKKLKQII